jgi:uncharacterized membrane protein HdeD (DUF308 family)
MIQTLIKNWWLLALRGILAAVLSVMTFLMLSSAESLTLREFALKGMVVFLGILALAAGACTIAAGIWNATHGQWWLLVLDGLAVCAAGLILILANSISFRMVTQLLVVLAMLIGIVELSAARMLRRHVSDEWFLGLAGAASVGFALTFLWSKPEETSHSFIWLGSYAAFSAICMFGLALRLRSLRRAIHKIASAASHGD